jgi:hypothetical protein
MHGENKIILSFRDADLRSAEEPAWSRPEAGSSPSRELEGSEMTTEWMFLEFSVPEPRLSAVEGVSPR